MSSWRAAGGLSEQQLPHAIRKGARLRRDREARLVVLQWQRAPWHVRGRPALTLVGSPRGNCPSALGRHRWGVHRVSLPPRGAGGGTSTGADLGGRAGRRPERTCSLRTHPPSQSADRCSSSSGTSSMTASMYENGSPASTSASTTPQPASNADTASRSAIVSPPSWSFTGRPHDPLSPVRGSADVTPFRPRCVTLL